MFQFIKKNLVLRKLNDVIPKNTLTGKIFRISIYSFLLCIPIYIYENNINKTMEKLQVPCSEMTSLSEGDKTRINQESKTTNMIAGTVSVCTQLPVRNTTLNTSNLSTTQQLTNFPIPFFGSIFYFFLTNFVVLSSLVFMFWVIVEERFPVLGKSFFRQYLTCGLTFILTTAVIIPTISSVQLTSLSFNAVNYQKLALDNRLLCSSQHVFDGMAKINALPVSSEGYRIVPLDNNRNAIVCFGRELGNIPVTIPNKMPSHVVKNISNIIFIALIPLFLVGFLNIFKLILRRVSNR